MRLLLHQALISEDVEEDSLQLLFHVIPPPRPSSLRVEPQKVRPPTWRAIRATPHIFLSLHFQDPAASHYCWSLFLAAVSSETIQPFLAASVASMARRLALTLNKELPKNELAAVLIDISFGATAELRIIADVRWSYLLLRLLHLRAYFEYCSAYASTLGGAYFAVKNVSKALVFAHRQQLAARRMQNAQVAMRAKMHIILDHYALGRQTLAKTKTQLVQLWRQARIRQMPTMARALTATLSELQFEL